MDYASNGTPHGPIPQRHGWCYHLVIPYDVVEEEKSADLSESKMCVKKKMAIMKKNKKHRRWKT